MSVTGLTIGRGKLYFSQFPVGGSAGAGEIYLGSSPALSFERDLTTQTREGSQNGVRFVKDRLVVKDEATLSFTIEDMSLDKVSLWHAGPIDIVIQEEEAGLSEIITVQKGRYYQLGVSTENPMGIRYTSVQTITRNGTIVPLADNFEFSGKAGRIFIKEDAPNVSNGWSLVVNYSIESVRKSIVSPNFQPVVGSLRYVEDNLHGKDKIYFFPMVSIIPDGPADLKKKEWQTLDFSGDVIKAGLSAEFYYVEELDEIVALDHVDYILNKLHLSISQFLGFEDRIDVMTNTTLQQDVG